jgi:hypothetical protein
VLRLFAILIFVLNILPQCGMAQHAPDWLDAKPEEEWPDSIIIDSTVVEKHSDELADNDHYGQDPEQIFNQLWSYQSSAIRNRRFRKLLSLAVGWSPLKQ